MVAESSISMLQSGARIIYGAILRGKEKKDERIVFIENKDSPPDIYGDRPHGI